MSWCYLNKWVIFYLNFKKLFSYWNYFIWLIIFIYFWIFIWIFPLTIFNFLFTFLLEKLSKRTRCWVSNIFIIICFGWKLNQKWSNYLMILNQWIIFNMCLKILFADIILRLCKRILYIFSWTHNLLNFYIWLLINQIIIVLFIYIVFNR